jgi:AcrR family transcriptional regulator
MLELHGIGDVTTLKIAASANVRLATLHYHFENKEALLLAVLEELIADMSAIYEAEAESTGDPGDRIEQLVRAIWRYVGRTRNRQIAQIELTLYALRTKGSEWIAAKQYEAYIAFYKKLLVDSRSLPPTDSEETGATLGRFILSGIDGLILQAFALDDATAAEAGLETLIAAIRDRLSRLEQDRSSSNARG